MAQLGTATLKASRLWMEFSVPEPIAFIDLQAQRRRLGAPLEAAIKAAVEGGQWILGPQVGQLERDLAAWAGVKHAVACANGTDALLLVLRAWGVGPGDAVFVPAFTFAASGEVVALAGATPVFVDVLPRYLQHGPGEPGSGHRAGETGWQAHAQGGDAGRSVRPACGLSQRWRPSPPAKA